MSRLHREWRAEERDPCPPPRQSSPAIRIPHSLTGCVGKTFGLTLCLVEGNDGTPIHTDSAATGTVQTRRQSSNRGTGHAPELPSKTSSSRPHRKHPLLPFSCRSSSQTVDRTISLLPLFPSRSHPPSFVEGYTITADSYFVPAVPAALLVVVAGPRVKLRQSCQSEHS